MQVNIFNKVYNNYQQNYAVINVKKELTNLFAYNGVAFCFGATVEESDGLRTSCTTRAIISIQLLGSAFHGAGAKGTELKY